MNSGPIPEPPYFEMNGHKEMLWVLELWKEKYGVKHMA
jgi:hypothetical protein